MKCLQVFTVDPTATASAAAVTATPRAPLGIRKSGMPVSAKRTGKRCAMSQMYPWLCAEVK